MDDLSQHLLASILLRVSEKLPLSRRILTEPPARYPAENCLYASRQFSQTHDGTPQIAVDFRSQRWRWLLIGLRPQPAKSGRELLESHVVTYAPSPTVLYLIRNSPMTHPPTHAFLGVGDVHYKQDGATPTKNESGADASSTAGTADPLGVAGIRLQDLPNARHEAIAASRVFGENRLLLGRDATEAAFKAQPLADFEIIHIAAYGIASVKFPERAALALGSDPKSGEDGLLQVREIRDLSLNADLVTLSACDTGVGPLEGEEGIANLVRAFLFAGAKSVVASLWTANDPSTRTLMERFCRYIAGGEDKGSALRHAQMDLIAEFGNRALSLYWAGFIMVGGRFGNIRFRPAWFHTGMPQPARRGPRRGRTNAEQNRKNKVLNRDARRKEQLEDSTRCYDFAWFGTKRSEVQILSRRLILSPQPRRF